MVPTPKDEKPGWLLEGFDGKLPCLRKADGSFTIVESRDVLLYVDANVGAGSDEDLRSACVKFLDRVALFPAFAKYCKNTDSTADDRLRATLEERLKVLEELLPAVSSSSFVMGTDSPTLADASLAPIFLHMKVTLGAIKGTPLDQFTAALPKVVAYIDKVHSCPAFTRSFRYTESDAVEGWRAARGE